MAGKPYPWCAVLASADQDVLGLALEHALARVAPKGVISVRHRIERDAEPGHPDRVFLHLAVIFDTEADARDARFVEATHASLTRELQKTADAYAHAWGNIKRFMVSDSELREYHVPKRGTLLASPPPRRESATIAGKVASTDRSEQAAKPTEVPPTPKPNTAQKSLF